MTVTVNNAAVRPAGEPALQTVIAEPAPTNSASRCGIAEVSELTTFPMGVNVPTAPTSTMMLATKPVYQG